MDEQQRGTILTLLKADKTNRNFQNRYWFPYQDFLDPTDPFTAFSCENLEGKQGYVDLVENLLEADGDAKIFVEVYGYEEDNNEQFIYADTLIVFSRLPLSRIEHIFNGPKDIFPDGIGEETDFSRQIFLISDNGGLVPGAKLYNDEYSIYYCWWD